MSAQSPSDLDPLAKLRPGHPRLLATAADWTAIRARVAADPLAANFHAGLMQSAQAALTTTPSKYEKRGRRLLGVSREVVGRVLGLAYAYCMSGDLAYARRAEAEMLAAAAFPDWNPSHFLDTGEMTTALAIGCDWLDDVLTPTARATIHQAIIEKGLRPGLDPAAEHNWWHTVQHNWNQVCWGGLSLGALVTAEDEPVLARQVLNLTRAHIGHGLAPYAPDGVYPEGPSYWGYGTTYQVLLNCALESALGTDWDLAARPGFLASAGGVAQMTAPSGRSYNFSDGYEQPQFQPALFWFARRLGDPGLIATELRQLRDPAKGLPAALRDRFAVLTMIWWPATPAAVAAPALPLRWLGRGVNPIAGFRESWTDPAALYLGIKGGAAELNHAHMDAGSFVLEADGVRWGIELGMQDYFSLESKNVDLWNKAQDSQRWQVYRLNNHSHSTLTVDGQPHRVAGYGRFTHFSSADANPHAIADLTPVFVGQASAVHRGIRLLPGRRILVQDELSGLRPGAKVRWQLTTRAEVNCHDAAATLRQEGRSLQAQLLAPGDATFTVEPAEPPADDFNAPNPGASLLVATATAPADGTLRITIVLTPGEAAAPAPDTVPLAAWSQPSDIVAAPQPLYRDPVHDGAADPIVVWNPHRQRWWMFYTNRRANVPGLSGVAWVHGTRLGIAESSDGGNTWAYVGTAGITLPPEIASTEPTHWAPDIVTAADGTHHMFLTVVPGVFEDWEHPRHLVHLTSTDLLKWNYAGPLSLASDRVIDACVQPKPGGGWRLWYNNERDNKAINYVDSLDLNSWTDHGRVAVVSDRPGEGPVVFTWQGRHWMLVDHWCGLGVYHSTDLIHWTAQSGDLLATPGRGADDGVMGGHATVVVNAGRAWLFYFTHPERSPALNPDQKDTLGSRRSSIQVAELHLRDGRLTCDRDTPAVINLVPTTP